MKTVPSALLFLVCGVFVCPAQQVAASPQPIVSVAVNGGGDVSLFQGWPLLVQVTLVNPQAFDTSNPASPITISGGDGPWSNMVRLHVVDSPGTEQAWPVQISTQTANAIALGAYNRGVLEYYVNPSDTARLAAGSYQIWADVAGYQVNSAATAIAVAAEPGTLSDAQIASKHLVAANYLALTGQLDQAISTLDDLLAQQPNHFAGMELRGDLLAAAGRNAEAGAQYVQAQSLWLVLNAGAAELPVSLFRKAAAALLQPDSQQTATPMTRK